MNIFKQKLAVYISVKKTNVDVKNKVFFVAIMYVHTYGSPLLSALYVLCSSLCTTSVSLSFTYVNKALSFSTSLVGLFSLIYAEYIYIVLFRYSRQSLSVIYVVLYYFTVM